MIRWFYEWMLVRSLQRLPQHLCFLITEQDMREAPDKIEAVAGWCADLGIGEVTFHISSRDPVLIQTFLPTLRGIGRFAHLQIHYGDRAEERGEGMPVLVAIGKSGREEITECIRQLARQGVDPEAVDEQEIESRLTFRYVPDLVIKTGGQHLTDFLIWQSVYSELFFSDVNWRYFRKTDFLRALRDFQFRQRRFGA